MSNNIKVEDSLAPIEVQGTIRMVTKDAQGNIVSDETTTNNILLQIRSPIVRLLGGAMTPNSELPFIMAIGFGDDDTPPTINDTGLKHEVSNSRRTIAMAPTFNTTKMTTTFVVLYDLTDNDIDGVPLKEACLYTRDGIAVARTVIGSYTKVTGMYFEFYWTIGYQA